MGDIDPAIAQAVAIGQRNTEVIELFERFCRNVRVEVVGGVGLVERQTGLPIGMRAFRCAYASGGLAASMNLEDLALDFYEENCRECADRSPSGFLGDTIASFADAKRATLQVRDDRARAEAEALRRQRDERSARRARRGAGEPYPSVAQLERVGRLDPSDGPPQATDIEWLTRTASLAPEVITDATIAELVELAQPPEVPWATREAVQAVLVPLTAAGRVPKATASSIALGNLRTGAGAEAGKLLVAASEVLHANEVTADIAHSVVELAGRSSDPLVRTLSRFSGEAAVADPAPLLLCAFQNLDAVVAAIEEMLASALIGAEPPLLGPDGQPLRVHTTETNDPKVADRLRSIAAGACQPLLDAIPGVVSRLVEALARSLEAPDWDRYDAPPSSEITKTLAHILHRRYSEVAPLLVDVAPRLSEEGRRSLFKAVSRTLHDIGRNGASANVSDLVQLTVDRLTGDWGQPVATDAAVALSDLARSRPALLVGRAADLVGALVVEITQAVPEVPDLVVPPNPLAALDAYGRLQLREARVVQLQSAVGRLVEAGADDAVHALFVLLDTEDSGSPEAINVRSGATRLLGKVGARAVHLPFVVPRLYSGLLHTEPEVRAAAVRSWVDLARQPQSLPSTLLDLLPTLVFDGPVILPVLDLIAHLNLLEERRLDLLTSVARIAIGMHDTSFDGTEAVIAGCVRALRALAHGLADERAEVPLGTALIVSDRLAAHDLRDVLAAPWPRRLANSGAFAERALSVLASPELADYFNAPNLDVQVALLGCPYGLGLQPIERFIKVTDLHLPDHPWSALEMVEVLQRAARWDDAAVVAEHIATAIPASREYQARRELAVAIVQLAAEEARLRAGAATGTVPEAPKEPGQQLAGILASFDAATNARGSLIAATTPQTPARLTGLADRLEQSARAIHPEGGTESGLPTQLAWIAWADALRVVAHLLRWDAAVQVAEGDAGRHLRAGQRQAEVVGAGALAGGLGDPLLQPLATAITQVAAITQPGDVARLVRELAAVPLPVRAVHGPDRTARFWPEPGERDEEEQPMAVGICRLDGVLVTNAHVVRPDEVHELGLELRITDWPEGADAIEATFLSVLNPNQASLPTFRFPRVPADDDGVFRLSATGALSLSFTLPAGAPPQAFPIAARFVSADMDEVLPVAGHSELRLRPFDATTDGLTRRPQLDERLVELYSVLHGMDLNSDDVQAFCRLYTAIVDKVCDLQFDRAYRRGAKVTERVFHNDLFDRLAVDPALEGRVERGTRAAGGFLDIIHDRINAELKVAKQTSVTVETSHKYLGQPTDYASDTGAQLSILVVLDMTGKVAPPGVLENYLGWMVPALIGREDPRYPSLVGVIIVNANLTVPSGYSSGPGGPAAPLRPHPRESPDTPDLAIPHPQDIQPG